MVKKKRKILKEKYSLKMRLEQEIYTKYTARK